MEPKEAREYLKKKLKKSIEDLNKLLIGNELSKIEKSLKRISRGKNLPLWYEELKKNKTLKNLDGKSIGSVVEMLYVASLENGIFKNTSLKKLSINPARGIDIPELQIGIKSPSANYCTSEPFLTAYDRILGNENDVIVMITNFQDSKVKKSSYKMQIIDSKYLSGSEIADKNLCKLASKYRDKIIKEDESKAKKFLKFLCYINQSDWRAKQLLKLLNHLYDEKKIKSAVNEIENNFIKYNDKKITVGKEPVNPEEFEKIKKILTIKPYTVGLLDACDNWVVETHKDFGRLPNDNEWNRFKVSPLDGKITMSFALQWRYGFASLFGKVDIISKSVDNDITLFSK